jgi:HNH endonuclease
MSEERKSSLRSLQQRHENISSSIDQESTVDSYIDTKQDLLAIRDEHIRMYSSGLQESLENGKITKKEYDTVIAQINSELLEIGREQVAVKRSKRTFSHDVKEFLPCYSSVEDAYQKMVLSKVLSSSKAGQVRQSQNDRKALRKNVYEMYQSRRQKPGEPPGDFIREEFWCPVTRKWWLGPSKEGKPPPVKVAHIVPRSFIHDSGQTMRMFDEDTASLAVNPRNTLPMSQTIEEAFDSLDIVIVPLESARQEKPPIEFKCVLANKSIANRTATDNYRWKDLDGAPLEFVNNFGLHVGIFISNTVSPTCTGSRRGKQNGRHLWRVFGATFGQHLGHTCDEACCYLWQEAVKTSFFRRHSISNTPLKTVRLRPAK